MVHLKNTNCVTISSGCKAAGTDDGAWGKACSLDDVCMLAVATSCARHSTIPIHPCLVDCVHALIRAKRDTCCELGEDWHVQYGQSGHVAPGRRKGAC
jgi:hypothetical protein